MVDRNAGRKIGRREWFRVAGKTAAAACGLAMLPPTIQKALAIPAAQVTGSLDDVRHVVILMQENRSFDHYFGTMSGVRGFGDRILVPRPNGKTVWSQSDGVQDLLPFHLDTHATSAMRVEGMPHSWPDAQHAWDQGRFGEWPRFKRFQSMGYYTADDIPFQRALANAFTLCDAHHCSVQSGTFPNRTVFMTGTNFRPGMTTPGVKASDALIENGGMRDGTYGLYKWTTYPERLQQAGVSWRIYQDPSDNWNGVLAPWEAFEAYHSARPGDPLYDNALTRWTLEAFAQHVLDGTLPQVSWIVPSAVWSEHPAESSPLQGAAYTQRVLSALIANPEVWSRCVFIVTFDENDGFFDHVPPPAPPSLDDAGRMLGGSTLAAEDLGGLYYRNAIDGVIATRPYGLGPRVPLCIISPWSRGGWVCSQVFDHTSTIQFLEARFGVKEPNISAWHRTVSGDLTSCFDFERPNNAALPELPDMAYATGETLVIGDLPPVRLPAKSRMPRQDPGVRFSRALPYRLAVQVTPNLTTRGLDLSIENTGDAGAVIHVYDTLHLERPPYRYTVEAAKSLSVLWSADETKGRYDLQVLGPNGLFWHFQGRVPASVSAVALPEVKLHHHASLQTVELQAWNLGESSCQVITRPKTYRSDRNLTLTLMPAEAPVQAAWSVQASGLWYDFSVSCPELPGWSRRFAGRLETGRHGITDPALGSQSGKC